jgi:hypothetical protein
MRYDTRFFIYAELVELARMVTSEKIAGRFFGSDLSANKKKKWGNYGAVIRSKLKYWFNNDEITNFFENISVRHDLDDEERYLYGY